MEEKFPILDGNGNIVKDEDEFYDIEGKDAFIEEVARRARFTKGDIRLILNTMIEVFIDAVKNRREIFIRGFGLLYIQKLPQRKASKLFNEKILPESERVIFKLSSTIRNALKDAE